MITKKLIKRSLTGVFLLCLCSLPSLAQSKIQGYATKGAEYVSTQGLNSSQKFNRSLPNCTVTVYDTGTTNLSTIFSDSIGTAKANPFTTDSAGYWFFWANNGTYDVQFSGTGVTVPFTLTGYKIADATTGTVAGSGTTNRITKFTATATVGNSNITDNGTSVGINNTSPSASALLDLTSTTQGLAPPRMTTAQRDSIASPLTGLVIFNTTTGVLNYYNAGWNAVGAGGGTVSGSGTTGQLAKWSSSSALTNATAGSDYENPLTFSSPLTRLTNTISIQVGSASQNGYISSADWTTFNNKESTLTFNSPLSRSTNTISCATCATSSNNLSFFAATTSAQFFGVISDETGSGSVVGANSPTIVTPTIASFANSQHNHQNAAGGGQLAADLVFSSGLVPIAFGGTNSTSASYSTNGAFYWDGSKFITSATGGAGTLCLVSTDGGVPTFGSCAGSAATALSSMTAAVASNTINSGDNAQIWKWTLTTSSKTGWRLTENTASAAAGTPILIGIDTLSTSTVNPFQVTAGGTSNGIRVNTSGVLAAIGTGGITATDGDSATAFFTAGQIENSRGGTGQDSSASTGVARVNSGTWSFNAGISHLASSTSADLRGVLSDETGTGVAVFATSPTLTTPVFSSIVNTGTLTLPTSTDTLVGRATTDTLTNKTLTSPVISTIVNTGTLTLPTSTDTLVGRATTDTLTNKTLTSPIISTIVNTGTLTLPTSTDTLIGRATSDTLTNKTLDAEATGNSITLPSVFFIPAAGCNNTTASANFDLPTASAPTANCLTGSNTQQGTLDFSDSTLTSQTEFTLPSDWTGNIDADLYWLVTTGGGSNAVKWTIATGCSTPAATYDTSFNTAQTITTNVGSNNNITISSQSSITITGCTAGDVMHLKIGRDSTDTSTATARLIGLRLKLRRAM